MMMMGHSVVYDELKHPTVIGQGNGIFKHDKAVRTRKHKPIVPRGRLETKDCASNLAKIIQVMMRHD